MSGENYNITICLYHPSHLVGPLDNILCLYRAVVGKFSPDTQHLLIHVKGSTEKRQLWVQPYFSTSVLHVLFVWLEWF